ncbi:putative polyketide synthase [Xylaria cf. heliscus]|nr:putative polyketide synthase [Xylaria cf. heliscus]
MSRGRSEPIAIVGSACRFAGSASSPSKLWELLRNPVDLRQEIPDTRFSAVGFYHPEGTYHGHSNVKHAYLLDKETDLRAFDAGFFSVKPAEAKTLDPQQRFLLEVAYEALEAAGVPIASLEGSDTAVYVGSMFDDYGTMVLSDIQDTPTYFATGTGRSLLANRISYFFDWHGPSVTVDTACSSSLVAVHMAIQSLRLGESRVALACGTNLILGPENFIVESKLGMLSPDGRSRMWDERANGYARGDGVASLVLKTLSAALEDGDHIECIIRETGVNQDGATQGITVPNTAAQEALIRKTYEKAGLDLTNRSDHPQFFEAHGTGTRAGDPVEAEAVYRVFGSLTVGSGSDPPLSVGSIKTVFGHTEGAAGVAAVLKASLALQNASIPPNLLFDHVSDRVAPFYRNVQIPTATQPWPDVAGNKRRASVNSFGYGGTNAHAILENYEAIELQDQKAIAGDGKLLFTPFVFSAFSQVSLESNLRKFLEFLDINGTDIDLQDLAWTLQKRRSVFAWKTSMSASCVEDLLKNLRTQLEHKSTTNTFVKELPADKNRILGIFTGQGAQYVRMGAELIQGSKTARDIIGKLESYLNQLPDDEAPNWSLEAELLAEEASSRVYEAAFSQPLCTAIQILITDLLRLSGLYLDVVVGHSSGEIAAAYAAGRLTARDAITIAYFRGLHLQRISDTVRGAMMAVETTPEDAGELIADSVFRGRLWLAAVNSPTNVTISGDEDAVVELAIILEDEEISCHRLRVDRAYHSPHMLPCYEPYVDSLRRCDVSSQSPSGPIACSWYSSVFDISIGPDLAGLGDTYWASNLTQPVLFSQALSRALTESACNLVVEIGPHPSLKGPAQRTIQNVLGNDLPYSGTLFRRTDAIEAMSSALGFFWSHLDRSRIDLSKYEQAMNDSGHHVRLVKNLPPYSWNHETKYWYEPRSSRKMRRRPRAVHPLLGHITPDSASYCMSWRHLLRVSEMKWLSGHQIQNQVVFPAAGYICTAIEAARFLADSLGQSIRLIEIYDFGITQPIAFDDNDGVEVLISMTDIKRQPSDRVRARFTYAAALFQNADDLTLAASCDVNMLLGSHDPSMLPTRKPTLPHMISVEDERFYSALANLGYEFKERFRSLSGLKRKLNKASCSITPGDNEGLIVHPVVLDAALQSIILAYSYPYDNHLRTLHLPTTIKCIRLNPALFVPPIPSSESLLQVDAAVSPQEAGQKDVVGHVNLYNSTAPHAAIQVQRASFIPMVGVMAEQDRRVFSREQWIQSRPDGLQAARGIAMTDRHLHIVQLLERIAIFYLAKFDREIPLDHPKRVEFPTNCYLRFARHTTALAASGKHRRARREWLDDTFESIMTASKPVAHIPDVEIMHLVGSQMPRALRGETTMLEEFRANGNDILDRCYSDAFGLKESSEWVARSVKQLTERYSHMNILEIGAGTGGATRAVFREIGHNFRSYTYTDISAAFFDKAASSFSQHLDRMIFKTLDVEKDPVKQGFAEGAYDLIIAFFVIHATSDLSRSLRYIRKLVKAGGFLVVGEGQDVGGECTARSGLIFGTLPGWWLGADTGRTLSPHASPIEWDGLLRSTGWSGVDTSPPDSFTEMLDVFHFVSQAIDERVAFLREPLVYEAPECLRRMTKLAMIGGMTTTTSNLIGGLEAILMNKENSIQVRTFRTLLDIDYTFVNDDCTVVSVTELDSPVFKNVTEEGFIALKQTFESAKTLLWITSGRLADEPFSNMTVGFGRTAANEMPDLLLQQLEIVDPMSTTAASLAEVLLRFHALSRVHEDLLWSLEPEIVIDREQLQLLSRLRDIPELNDRYNSSRRAIFRDLDVGESQSRITAQFNSGLFTLLELPSYQDLGLEFESPERLIELRTTHSSLLAINTSLGPKFLMIGNETATGTSRISLTSSPVSISKVPSKSTIICPDISLEKGQLVALMLAHMVVMRILRFLEHGQTLISHNTPAFIAMALDTQAVNEGIRVVYTVDSKATEVQASWIRVPSYLSQSDAGKMLHGINPSCFVSFSGDQSQTYADEETLKAAIKPHCQNFLSQEMLLVPSRPVNADNDIASAGTIGELLRHALDSSRRSVLGWAPNTPVPWPGMVSLDYIARASHPQIPLTVVDWTGATSVPVQISRLDSVPLFKSTGCTYWIVGMTRALGLSLADWMIRNGAKSLVLTSRKPYIAPEWAEAHRQRGAQVHILPCDVTDSDAVQAVYDKIRTTLPPIQGVIHGAMILRDTSIKNMSFCQFTDVVRPKVNGGSNLDRTFYDTQLDFLVFVSSVNCVVGNVGQANYAAANTYLCSLAAQRRKRGLRAVTVDIGAIIGAGYLERESRRELDAIVGRLNLMRLSEEDWHQSICEAIHACRLESPYGAELTTGLGHVPFDVSLAPQWYSNPRFSSFIVPEATLNMEADVKTVVTVEELLRQCQSKEDIQGVVQGAFCTQLRTILQVTVSDEDMMASRTGNMGLDSLVSVDIRSWFLRHLQVNVPVLKIMGNETIAGLVEFVAENLPLELVPGLAEDNSRLKERQGTKGSGEVSTIEDASTEEASQTPVTQPDLDRVDELGGVQGYRNGKIDWEAEFRLPADMASILAIPKPRRVRFPPRVVVLTGCTGLLGHHLLSYLIADRAVEKVICLAVRSLSSRLQHSRLPRSPRVVYYEGDLRQPLLGLSEEDATLIFDESDAVIHNGSDTSHLTHYVDLRVSNVNATALIARLCTPRRIPLHYVSSAGVGIFHEKSGTEGFPPGPVRPAPDWKSDGSFGYICAKWVCEKLLESTSHMYGLQVYIHRPSTILREGDDAMGEKAEKDWVNALLVFVRRLKAAPMIDRNPGTLDLVYVKTVCEAIIERVFKATDQGVGVVTYVHEVGDKLVSLSSLHDIGLDEQQRAPYYDLSFDEWMAKAVLAGMHTGRKDLFTL